MKAFAIFKPSGGTEDFSTLIFNEGDKYFIQEEDEFGKTKYIPCEYEENEILKLKEQRVFDKDEENYVYSFVDKNEKITIGYWWELTEFLLSVLRSSEDIQLKYRIGEELKLRGLIDRLKIQRDTILNSRRQRISFQKEDAHFSIRELNSPYDNLLDDELEFYNDHFVTKDLNISWDDVVSTKINPNRKSLIIDNFSFDLASAFDHIIKQGNYFSLSKMILRNTNAPVSFMVENRVTHQSKDVDSDNLSKIADQIKQLNNG